MPFGQLVANAAVSQNLSGVPAKLTLFNSTGQKDSGVESDASVVLDIANDRITCHNPGTYRVAFNGSLYTTGPRLMDFFVYVDGLKQAGLGSKISTPYGSKRISTSFDAIVDLPSLVSGVPTNQIEIWASAYSEDSNNGAAEVETVTFELAQFSITRLR